MNRTFGIDLGTTNTVVFRTSGDGSIFMQDALPAPERISICYNENELQGLKRISMENLQNRDYLPSLGKTMRDPTDESKPKLYVGEVARRLDDANYSGYVLKNTKRLMDKDDDLGDGFRAADFAGALFQTCIFSIKRKITNFKDTSERICITHPASFNPFSIVSLDQIVKKAGFKKVVSIEEPRAALLSYLYQMLSDPKQEQSLLELQAKKGGTLCFCVIDIGGGTTDVTIQKLKIEGTHQSTHEDYSTGYIITFINEKSTEGTQSRSNDYEAFGGLDFDEKIANQLIPKMLEKCREWDIVPSEDRKRALGYAAYLEAKEGKEYFGNHPNGERRWAQSFTLSNGSIKEIAVQYTANSVFQWTSELCKEIANPRYRDQSPLLKDSIFKTVQRTLELSRFQLKDIDFFYATGGMSKYPPIRSLLQEEYGSCAKLEFSSTPIDDVARGASLIDSYFRINIPFLSINKGILLDNPCGKPIQIIAGGQELPIPPTTIDNIYKIINPVELCITVLSGNSPYDPNLCKLKTLWARNIPPVGIGTPVSIECEITKDQLIRLTMIIRYMGEECRISIDADRYQLKIK